MTRTSIRFLSLVTIIAVTIFAVKLPAAFKPPSKKREQGGAGSPCTSCHCSSKNTKTHHAGGRTPGTGPQRQFIFSITRRHHHRETGLEVNLVDFARKRGYRGMNARVEAGHMPIPPIALTTFTTFLGISPLICFATGQTAFHTPMAVSTGFGLLFTSGPIPVDTKFLYDRR